MPTKIAGKKDNKTVVLRPFKPPRKFKAGRDRARVGFAKFTHTSRGNAGPERNFWDKTANGILDDTAAGGFVQNLALVPEGTGTERRIGRKITVKSVHVRMQLRTGSGTTMTMPYRLMLVWDKQANGATATPAELLYLSGSTPYAYNELSNSDRFAILRDTWGVVTKVAAATDLVDEVVTWDVPVEIPIEYLGATGVISEVKSNNLILMAFTTNSVVEGHGGIDVISRIRFLDS